MDCTGSTVRIPLGNGGCAIVDAADAQIVSGVNWSRIDSQRKDGAIVSYARGTLDGRKVSMHRLVLGTPSGMDTDHKNGDGLDNRRANLRSCTRQQNLANQRRTRGASRFKGVSFHRGASKWHAEIFKDGTRIHLGLHLTEEAAARAYDAKASELFGEFARLNFTSAG